MKVKIEIPADWSGVTVRQFQELNEVWEACDDVRQRAVAGVRILCKVEQDTASRLTVATLDKCYAKLDWLMHKQDVEMPLIPQFELGRRKYGLIPDFSKLSLGEFIDLENNAKDGFFDKLHVVMSILYRPITEQWKDHYTIEPYAPSEAKNEAMREATMDVVLGAMVFFSHIASRLAVDMRNYLQKAQAPH